jgi:hypothetical protein
MDNQQNEISLTLTNRPKVVKREKGKWRLQNGILKTKKRKKLWDAKWHFWEKKIEIAEKDKKNLLEITKKHPEHSWQKSENTNLKFFFMDFRI